MILYVNGDSHTAAAEAVNAHAFAEDDPNLGYLHRLPHPDNLAVSWGRLLSETLKAAFHCDAESAASNDRIMRTTQSWIDKHQRDWSRTLMIIQWSTWEREEWLHEETYYQVNASGIDDVPLGLQDRYKQFVASVDWQTKTQHWHQQIWQLHLDLAQRGIRHVFFNGNSDFSAVPNRLEWGANYLEPYSPEHSFSTMLSKNYQTVAPNSYHFGQEAHRFFAHFMLQYCIANKLI